MDSRLPQLGDWSTFEELAALQEDRLAWTMRQARRSPFYQRHLDGLEDPSTVAELHHLPQTTKAHLRDNYPFGLLAVPRSDLATYHESSGTSGEPSPSFFTAADWQDLSERYARKAIGLVPSDVFLVRAPYALPLTGHLAHAGARLKGAMVVPGDLRSSAMPYARVIRVMHDLDVTVTWSMPAEALLLAAAARVAGYRPDTDFPHLRAMVLAGEPMTPARRRRITRLWGVPVEEEYGSTETGTLAGDCPHGRLHLWTDRVIAEVYDPATGLTRADGRGQLVITTLYREAMPLIRYNLEDTVDVSYSGCPCGWPTPTIAIEGRSAFVFHVGGREVTQQRVEDLVFELPDEYGVLFWRARAEADLLSVEMEVDPDHAEPACAALADLIARDLGTASSVTAIKPGTLVGHDLLAASPAVVKPRSLFGPDEDWSKAIIYF
jgi:phenylacetate-CoA ligase